MAKKHKVWGICPQCRGEGAINKNVCPNCKGSGHAPIKKSKKYRE